MTKKMIEATLPPPDFSFRLCLPTPVGNCCLGAEGNRFLGNETEIEKRSPLPRLFLIHVISSPEVNDGSGLAFTVSNLAKNLTVIRRVSVMARSYQPGVKSNL
jgi:hypothetical protein